MAGIEVRIEGLEAVLAKLKPALYAGPLRKFWERAARAVARGAKNRAPVDTGRLRSSLDQGGPQSVFEIDASTPPMYAKVGTDVFYAPFQEFGTKFMAGKYYLQGGFEAEAGTITAAVDALGGEIAQSWGA